MSTSKPSPALPSGWAWTTLGEVVDAVPLTGRKLPQGQYLSTGSLPVVDQGQGLIGGYTDREDLRIHVERPVIVFGDHTKAIKYVDFDFVAGADGVKPLVPWEVFFPKLFYYSLLALQLPDKGYARHYQFLAKSSVPLPPFPEQRRIVAKIEELFSQLDAGVEALKKAKAQLKRYRQAVLKAAFEGKLTEEWRKANKGKVEPASALLERIKAERKKALGKKYRDTLPLDTSDLSELPEGWAYTRVGDIALLVTKGSTPTSYGFDYVASGIRYVKVENIVGERVVADADMQFIARDAHSFLLRSQLASGDVLYTIAGTIGKVAVVHDEDLPANTNQAVAIIRVPLDHVRPDYLKYALMSPRARESIVRKPRGVGMNNVSLGDVRDLVCGFPSQAEQLAVVDEIERRLSVADAEEKAIDAALKQAARLRQSILKRAFEGKLVSQDPTDEPATELLKRIREERLARSDERLVRRQKRLATSEERRGGKRRGRAKGATSD